MRRGRREDEGRGRGKRKIGRWMRGEERGWGGRGSKKEGREERKGGGGKGVPQFTK